MPPPRLSICRFAPLPPFCPSHPQSVRPSVVHPPAVCWFVRSFTGRRAGGPASVRPYVRGSVHPSVFQSFHPFVILPSVHLSAPPPVSRSVLPSIRPCLRPSVQPVCPSVCHIVCLSVIIPVRLFISPSVRQSFLPTVRTLSGYHYDTILVSILSNVFLAFQLSLSIDEVNEG